MQRPSCSSEEAFDELLSPHPTARLAPFESTDLLESYGLLADSPLLKDGCTLSPAGMDELTSSPLSPESVYSHVNEHHHHHHHHLAQTRCSSNDSDSQPDLFPSQDPCGGRRESLTGQYARADNGYDGHLLPLNMSPDHSALTHGNGHHSFNEGYQSCMSKHPGSVNHFHLPVGYNPNQPQPMTRSLAMPFDCARQYAAYPTRSQYPSFHTSTLAYPYMGPLTRSTQEPLYFDTPYGGSHLSALTANVTAAGPAFVPAQTSFYSGLPLASYSYQTHTAAQPVCLTPQDGLSPASSVLSSAHTLPSLHQADNRDDAERNHSGSDTSPSLNGQPFETINGYALKPANAHDLVKQGIYTGLPVTRFISTLWFLVQNSAFERFIRWLPDQRSVLIDMGQPRFAQSVLLPYFNHANVNSLLRQFNAYDFVRLSASQLLEQLDVIPQTSGKPSKRHKGAMSLREETRSKYGAAFVHPLFNVLRPHLTAIKPKSKAGRKVQAARRAASIRRRT
ncbi:hypothetical protein E5Q_06715 [Mixia osmundae IAM 14324]|uniref:HSF-type DNA-binding domain-containing protein n=1 Tax=Mixia osmundae (strain CBS 9802 / IAM 14324 / JCM 22182 / KY 12970) TaxID=764103 RepID=G7EB02_MIXOS|nr:hypothetical protein E5Q_06715 [Mixia osmundae IAM 14324]